MVKAQRRDKEKNNYVTEVTSDELSLISDVNPDQGGDNLGLDPHELLEAALAACTTITVQMYANRKGYKLKTTHVEVKVVSEGKESVIDRKVSFEGELSDEEKARLLEISNKCPIHRLLISNITINTTMA